MSYSARHPTTRSTAVLAVVAAALFGWSLARTVFHRTSPLTSFRASKIGAAIILRPRDTSSDDLIGRSVERDPFSMTRTTNAESLVVDQHVIPREPLRVLGTVVDSTGGSFVLCQLGAARPILLRIGQRIGDYELNSVDKATAIFTLTGGGRVELRVPRAGS